MSRRFSAILTFIIIFCFTAAHERAWATLEVESPFPTLHILAETQTLSVPGKAQYLRDETAQLTYEQVANDNRSLEWRPLLSGKTNFGWTDDAFWIRFNIQNESNPNPQWNFTFPFSRIDLVEAYLEQKTSVEHLRTGLRVPFHTWPVNHNRLTIPVTVPRGTTKTVYFRITNSSVMNLDCTLLSPGELLSHQKNSIALFTAFSVFMLCILSMVSIFIIIIQGRQYLLFSAHIVLSYLLTLTFENFDFVYLYPSSALAPILKNVYGGLALIVFFSFLAMTLEISNTRNWRHLLVRVAQFSFLFLTLLCPLTSGAWLDKISAGVGTFVFPMQLVLVASCLRASRQVPYLLIGFVGYFCCMGIYVPSVTGIIRSFDGVEMLPFIGSITQLIFIVLGIIKRNLDLNRSLSTRNVELGEANQLLRTEIEFREKLSTQLKWQQRSAEEMKRLQILGEITANIANEIKMPLSILSFNLGFLLQEIQLKKPNQSKILKTCNSSLNLIERTISTVQTLHLLARDRKIEAVTTLSLATNLAQLNGIYNERAAAANVTIRLRIPEHDIVFQGHQSAIFQMLANLVNYAIGSLKSSNANNKWLELAVEEQDELLRFTLSNNGPGVPPELTEKIFEPFYNTSVGLGLSFARTIAREHGGDLVLDHPIDPTRFICTIRRIVK